MRWCGWFWRRDWWLRSTEYCSTWTKIILWFNIIWELNISYVPGGVRRFRILGSARQVLMNSSRVTFPSPSLSIIRKIARARSDGFKCARCALVVFIIWKIDLTSFCISANSIVPFPSMSYILKIIFDHTFLSNSHAMSTRVEDD